MAHNQTDELLKLKCLRPYLHWRLKAALAALFLAASVAGCALDIDMRVGRRPNLPALERRLRVGQSTTDDVLAVVGPPHGKGYAMLPIDPKRRVTWSYMYLRGSIQTEGETRGDMRSLVLFVFFEQDRYAGYMWFSSVPDERAERSEVTRKK